MVMKKVPIIISCLPGALLFAYFCLKFFFQTAMPDIFHSLPLSDRTVFFVFFVPEFASFVVLALIATGLNILFYFKKADSTERVLMASVPLISLVAGTILCFMVILFIGAFSIFFLGEFM
jgi:hypothetical protein